MKADLMNLIRNKSNSKNTGYEMDFWTEEENTRFTNALIPSSDAQNWDVICEYRQKRQKTAKKAKIKSNLVANEQQ